MCSLKRYRGLGLWWGAIYVTAGLALFAHADPAVKASILTFDGGSYWEATRVIVEPASSGGLMKTHKIEPFLSGGNCGDLLQEVQKRPLEVMLQNGYIDKQIYDTLMDLSGLGIVPPQVTTIRMFSDLSREEVRLHFPDGLPAERVMKSDVRMAPGSVRITRGTLLIVRGYEVSGYDGRKPTYTPHNLPWELDGNKKRRIDRSKVPYVVEIGRAHVEGKPLPGDFKVAAHLATAILARDADLLGIDPDRLLVTGHFLDSQHTRLFTRSFPLRPLSDDWLDRIENEGGLPANYLEKMPLPSDREGWEQLNDAVTVGSLAAYLRQFPIEKISASAKMLQDLATPVNAITGVQAQAIATEYTTNMREDFDFDLGPVGRGRAPVTIMDYGSPLLGFKMVRSFMKRGLPFDEALLTKGFGLLANWQRSPHPDLFLDRWIEKVHAIPVDGGSGQFRQAWFVSNLDPQVAKQSGVGIIYPAAVLLSMAALVDKRIDAFTPDRFRDFMQTVNEKRAERRLPPIPSAAAVEFFDSFPLYVHTENAQLIGYLRELGGKAESTQAMALKFDRGLGQNFDIKVEMRESQLYRFDGQTLARMRQLYHGLNQNAAARLKPTVEDLRVRLMQSGAF